jgi:hypothetical protein
MKLKKITSPVLLVISSLILFSCSSSTELIKKKYHPGYYIAHSWGKEKKKNAQTSKRNTGTKEQKKHVAITESHNQKYSPLDSIALPYGSSDFLKCSVTNSDKLIASTEKTRDRKINTQKAKLPQFTNKRHFPSSHSFQLNHDDTSKKKQIPLLYKVAIVFLLLCLVSLLFGLLSVLFPEVLFLAYAGAIFPEAWLIGIVHAIIGLINYWKTPAPLSLETKHNDIFSRISFILTIVEFVLLLSIIVATFFALHSLSPLITLIEIFMTVFLVSFVCSIVGLINVLKNPEQVRKNRLKAILNCLFSIVPAILLVAWLIAVASFIYAAIPYVAFLIFILH